MDGWFVCAVVVAFLAISTIIAHKIVKAKLAKVVADREESEETSSSSYGDSRKTSRSGVRENKLTNLVRVLKYTMIGLWILSGMLMAWSSVHKIDTKNVGAVTTFGKPGGNLDNGLHLTWPWQVVTELDAALQTDSYAGQDDTPCITVRIAHQATACVDFTVKWQLRQDKADEIFQTFREFDRIRNSLITTELPATGNEVLANYDPMAVNEKGEFTADSNVVLSQRATEVLTRRSGRLIQIDDVVVNNVHLGIETQNRLNELNNEVAKTRVAIQAQRTADEQAAANRKLAGSVSNDPNVLVSRCLDLMGTAIDKGYQLPAGGINCWPGGNSAVVLPGAGAK